MRALWLVVGAVAAVCVQAACGGWLEVHGARPDVVLAVVMSVGLLAGRRVGLLAGVAAGCGVAALSPQQPWLWVALYGAAGAAAGWWGGQVYHERWWWPWLCVFVGGLVLGSVACLLGAPEDRSVLTWRELIGWVAPSSLYSSLIAPVVFLLLKRLRA